MANRYVWCAKIRRAKACCMPGTETGVYVSYDAGAQWLPFRGNFPVVPVTDLQVKHGDLIAATEGRAFWILDDLSVIRQRADSLEQNKAHLYAPREAVLFAGSGGFGTPQNAGKNPPNGATVYFRVAAAPDSATAVSVEFLDAKGAVVRAFASRDSLGRLAVKPGLNTLTWNLRRAMPTRVGNVLLFGAPGDGGARVSPGTYTVRLTVGSTVLSQPLVVRQDPRLDAPAAVIAERDSVANLLAQRITDIHESVLRLRDVKAQVQGYVTRAKETTASDTIAKAGRSLAGKLDKMDPRLTTKAANGQDIINYANGINGQYGFLLGQVEGNTTLTQPVKDRLAELEKVWGWHSCRSRGHRNRRRAGVQCVAQGEQRARRDQQDQGEGADRMSTAFAKARRERWRRGLATTLLIGALPLSIQAQRARAAATPYVPPAGAWERRSPAAVGVDSVKLAEAVAFAISKESTTPRDLELNHLRSFGREPLGDAIGPLPPRGAATGVIIRRGYVVATWG